MSYARNLLSRGEEVVFESRQHWFAVLGETWPFVIAAVLAFAVLIWSSTSDTTQLLQILQIVSLVALIVSLARIALKVWSWRNQATGRATTFTTAQAPPRRHTTAQVSSRDRQRALKRTAPKADH